MSRRNEYREREFWRDYDQRMDDAAYDRRTADGDALARSARSGDALRRGDVTAALYESMGASGVLRYRELRDTGANDAEERASRGREEFQDGKRCLDAGDLNAADRHFSTAIWREPSQSLFWFYRGLCRKRLGRLREALADFDTCISRDTRPRGPAYNQRGILHGRLGNHDKALQDLNVAVATDPDSAALRFNRGMCRLDRGDDNDAIADFTAALERAPDDPKILLMRGTAQLRLGNLRAALSDLDLAASGDARDPRIYNRRAIVHSRAGRDDEARADYNRAIELAPDWGIPMLNRARLHFERQRHKAALSDCIAATELFVDAGDATGAADAKVLIEKIFSAD